jgi:DNA-binding CsgD family transcriptional regulator/tetratricopeptide (TPR) repeat protein
MTDVARLGVGIELVGRRAELAELTGALARAAAGHPCAVLLAGDAGVGKSRLLAELVEHAGGLGHPVLIGRCLDTAESALPYLPFTEIVGRLADTRPELVTRHAALRSLLPGRHARDEQAVEDRAFGQVRVFDAVLSVLDELATDTPSLVVLEDLHWADRSSRDLLAFLLSRLSGQRLVLVASYRTDDMHRRHPLRPVLAELVRLPAVQRMELAPLGPADTLALVRRLADGKLPEPALHRAARRSEGNAFFAEELVSGGAYGMPHELAELLVARIDGLPPTAQRVLRVAAVAGRRVRHEPRAAVSGVDTDELEQALRDAAADRVLVATGSSADGGDGYAFRHALLREAVYHELLPGERSRIHAAYAAALVGPSGPGGLVEPGRAAELAHHALAGHDLPLALAASVRAAGEADERDAPAELSVHAERALELWQAVPDAEAVAGVDEVTVTRWAAWGASATGDPDRAIALGRRALELAEQRSDPRLSALLGRLYALRLLDLGGREPEALAAARRALSLIATGPPSADLAWAHAVLARVLGRLDQLDEAAGEAQAARAIAARLPDDDRDALGASAYALVTLAICDEYGGRPERSRRQLDEATALARRAGNLSVELRAYLAIGLSLLDAGRLPAAADQLAAGARRAEATATTWSGYGLDLRVALVVARFLQGDWDSAAAAAELAGESVSARVAARLAAVGLLVTAGRGRFDAVDRRLAELHAPDSSDDQVIMFAGQAGAESALWQGRPGVALDRVREAIDGLTALPAQAAVPHLGSIMLAALGVAAQADLVAAGELQPAVGLAEGRLLVEVAERAATHGLPRGGTLGPEGRAWLRQARAELTRFEQPDPEAWTAVFDAFGYEAAEASPPRGDPPSGNGRARAGPEPGPVGYRQACALLRRAQARLLGGGSRQPVEEDLRVALRVAEGLAAAPLAGAVRALAGQAGIALPDSSAARTGTGPATGRRAGAADGGGPLTPRELSVLTLVAGGRTNRQVGGELFISEKTVSVHLSRVMAKLGATSRTEAVSLAYSRGLLSPPGREAAVTQAAKPSNT